MFKKPFYILYIFAYTHLVCWQGKVCICHLNNPKSAHWRKVSWSPLPLTAVRLESSCQQTSWIRT